MANKITEKRRSLEEALKTVNYQIANLKQLYSREQVRCWYIRRNRLAQALANLPTEQQLKADAKSTTALIKSIIHRK